MKCDFVVGQRVVCILERWTFTMPVMGILVEYTEDPGKCPVKGQIYKILEMDVMDHPIVGEVVGLRLEGIGGTRWWDSRGFRPLQKRSTETSIEVFTSLLGRVTEDA